MFTKQGTTSHLVVVLPVTILHGSAAALGTPLTQRCKKDLQEGGQCPQDLSQTSSWASKYLSQSRPHFTDLPSAPIHPSLYHNTGSSGFSSPVSLAYDKQLGQTALWTVLLNLALWYLINNPWREEWIYRQTVVQASKGEVPDRDTFQI